MLQNKKMLVTTTIASALLVPLIATSHVHAASWHATTPAMITKLNNDGTYTVKSGDTLWAIGMHYNIKPSVIAAANGIINPNSLQVRTIIKLSNVNHNHAILTIKKGNTISQQYLTNNDKINPSQSFNKAVTTPTTNKQVTTKTSVSPTPTVTTTTNSVTTSSSSTTNNNQNNDQMVQRINSELKQVDGNAVTSYNIKKVDNDRYFVYDASSKSNEPIWVVDAHTGAMLKA